MSVKDALRFKCLLNDLSKKQKKKLIIQLFTHDDLLIYKMLFNQCINNKLDAQKLIQRISKKMLAKKEINKKEKKVAVNKIVRKGLLLLGKEAPSQATGAI